MKRLITTIIAKSMTPTCMSMALAFTCLVMSSAFTGAGFSANAQRYSTDEPEGRYQTQSTYCRELERELASDWVRGRRGSDQIPALNKKIRRQDALFNKHQNKADRMNCYENMFIFGRSLRRTKRCIAIDRKIRGAKRKLARLREEKSSINDSRRGGNRRNQLIDELSRNNCGEQYRYQARRNSNSWIEDSGLSEFFGGRRRRSRDTRDSFDSTIQPYATYRTMCVRLCDGYYFPVSFSTLPSNFPKDTDICQNKCSAPAELFVYRNPGGEVEQMISPTGSPYDSLKNAWRYRKEYIKGCSCKPTEYSRLDIDDHNNPKKQASNTTPSDSKNESNSSLKNKKSDFDKAETIEDLIR